MVDATEGDTDMPAFDHFQRATCHISEGNRAAAIKCIDKALDDIARTGRDAHMADDLAMLRRTLERNAKRETA